MKVYTVILVVSVVIDDLQTFGNEDHADQEYAALQQEYGDSDKYEILQYENELETRQDAMTERYGYLGVTVMVTWA